MSTLGFHIFRLRTNKKIGLRELARKVSAQSEGKPITHAYLSAIEKGRRLSPTPQVLESIAKALEVPPIELQMAGTGWTIVHLEELIHDQPQYRAVINRLASQKASSQELFKTLAALSSRSPLSSAMPRCVVHAEGRCIVAFLPRTNKERQALAALSK